jgi:hydrogenase-1 operon protein HyaF
MNKSDLIPLTDLDGSTAGTPRAGTPRPNPMIWEGEEAAQGVFLGAAAEDDPLAVLGTPPLALPAVPRLPEGFRPSATLRAWLHALRDTLAAAGQGNLAGRRADLADLDTLSRQAVEEILGEGEVSGSLTLDQVHYTVRESLLPGVWQVRCDTGNHWVEVGSVPGVVTRAADSLRPAPLRIPEGDADVMNGLAVLAEISDRAAHWRGEDNHVINFTLLPMSAGDHELLTRVLGRADLALTSGGFGDCHIVATTVRHVWAVQYVNAMGHTILDTIEIGGVPAAACAGREDLEDSARRFRELLETYGL